VVRLIASFVLAMILLTTCVPGALAGESTGQGAVLFEQHCAGCHLHGGNIIRRGKNLKLATLQRRGLDSAEAIAAIASNGIGQMSGYGDALGDGGDRIVADWILEQAQNAWIQG
jgi:cytochrome c6